MADFLSFPVMTTEQKVKRILPNFPKLSQNCWFRIFFQVERWINNITLRRSHSHSGIKVQEKLYYLAWTKVVPFHMATLCFALGRLYTVRISAGSAGNVHQQAECIKLIEWLGYKQSARLPSLQLLASSPKWDGYPCAPPPPVLAVDDISTGGIPLSAHCVDGEWCKFLFCNLWLQERNSHCVWTALAGDPRQVPCWVRSEWEQMSHIWRVCAFFFFSTILWQRKNWPM